MCTSSELERKESGSRELTKIEVNRVLCSFEPTQTNVAADSKQSTKQNCTKRLEGLLSNTKMSLTGFKEKKERKVEAA